jgi:peroxiredoxin
MSTSQTPPLSEDQSAPEATVSSAHDLSRLVSLASEPLVAAALRARCLAVDEYAPDFELPNDQGRLVSLEQLLSKGTVALSFEHGPWCAACQKFVSVFLGLVVRRVDYGALAIISPSPAPMDRELGAAGAVQIERLIDAGGLVANLYGVMIPLPHDLASLAEVAALGLPRTGESGQTGLPVPAVFVIDHTGIVRRAIVDPGHVRAVTTGDVAAVGGRSDDEQVF